MAEWLLAFAIAAVVHVIVLAAMAATCRAGLSGMAVFAGAHMIVGAATLVFDLSLAPIQEHLAAVAAAAILPVLALAQWALREEPPAGGWRVWCLGLLWGTRPSVRPGGVDLKKVAYRTGVLWLTAVVASLGYAQFHRYGEVTPPMGLFIALWWAVAFAHVRYEAALETTAFYLRDGTGIVSLGTFLVGVPFLLPLGGIALLDPSYQRSAFALALGAALVAGGLWVERSAAWQKHRFLSGLPQRRGAADFEALEGKLLISGWWGVGRYLNYTGELAMLWGFAFLAAGESPLPYAVPLLATLALAWRAGREERRCAAEYGPLWDAYRARAWLRLLPLF